MIDIHSHILPGIDDGAADIDESLAMLRKAVQDGVKTQVLTPHIQHERYPNDCRSLKRNFDEFKSIVAEHDIDIELRLAAEIRIGPELMKQVADEEMLWIGEWQGEKVFLLEFPHSNVPVGSINVIKWLRKQHILPMIVHPERNREIQQNPEKLKPYFDADCLVQITAGSLTGQFGRPAYNIAATLLQNERVTVMATDCHNMRYRPPMLNKGVEAAAAIIGIKFAKELVSTRPEKLLTCS